MVETADDAIRVLIVDDIAETRENIRKLLQFEPDIEVVDAASTGIEAIEIARETEPDVVLMDINMPDMDGITATEALLKDVPFAQIIILSVQSDADYMRRAMLAGARDFIPKPPSGDELIGTIRNLAVRAREQRQKLSRRSLPQVIDPGTGALVATGKLEGKVISVYSAKGGVGCSVIATNLAIGLNTSETPTVLVDAGLQFGDVAVSLNLQTKYSFVDLAARADELEQEIVDEILLRHESGLRVLAAPPRPEMADEIHAEQVRSVLQYLKRQFPYVVIDASSNMDDITLAVMDMSDMLIVVATPEIPAIKDARLLFDLLGVLEYPKERIFFVLNKMDRKSGITIEAVADNLKCTVDGVIPFEEKAITLSINRGIPVIIGEKGKPPAKSMLDLIGLVRQRLVRSTIIPEDNGEERPRLFSSRSS
ncbi:MAG: response regulator [Anaerolineales bacterium]|nr:response regulator [Anaerolineales bacterium]